MTGWVAALTIDPARRDREIVLADLLRPVLQGARPDWAGLADSDLRRRAGYLVDLAQHLRGQTVAEAAELAGLRASLAVAEPAPFWPGERPLPPGADPIAERWGFSRGVDVARLRAALQRRPDLLPAMP